MNAMTTLGNGLSVVNHNEDALTVQQAMLSMQRRLGASEVVEIGILCNISITHDRLGRHESALQMKRDVYSGFLKLKGGEDDRTLIAANNFAASLVDLQRFKEAKSLMRKTIPVARRVLGEGNDITLKMKKIHAEALYKANGATLSDLHEAVTTLEDAGRTARRVLGGAHPTAKEIEVDLRAARAALRAREGDVEPLRAAVEAMAPGDA